MAAHGVRDHARVGRFLEKAAIRAICEIESDRAVADVAGPSASRDGLIDLLPAEAALELEAEARCAGRRALAALARGCELVVLGAEPIRLGLARALRLGVVLAALVAHEREERRREHSIRVLDHDDATSASRI